MKMRKTIIGALALLATAITSSAAVQNITVNDTGNFLQNGAEPDGVLSLASNEFYGSFASTNNSPENNYAFLAGVVENWNSTRMPTLPTATYSVEAANVDSIGNGRGATSFTTVAGYDYVVFHFGNGQAGAGGGPRNADENGWWQAWYLGGKIHKFSLPQEGNPLEDVGGFSSARYFNGTSTNVPDGGSTLIALGAGLLGLGGVRRFLIKA